MGKPGLPGPLVLRSDVIPDVHCDNGRLVVFMHDQGQPVLQDKFLVGNIDVAHLCIHRRTGGGKKESSQLRTHGIFTSDQSIWSEPTWVNRLVLPPRLPAGRKAGRAAAFSTCRSYPPSTSANIARSTFPPDSNAP